MNFEKIPRSMDSSRASDLIAQFGQKSILVIGDLMLDEFLWGKVSRISPEAPVPVVEVVKEEFFPGAAANVARNIAEFSRGAHLMGVIGSGQHADQLLGLLQEEGIGTDGVGSYECYRTIVKTRIIARQQHVVRIDREQKLRLRDEHLQAMLATFETALPKLDAVIIQDYGKGLLTQDLVNRIIELASAAGKLVAVDPNPNNPLEWRGVHVVKPNRAEAFASAGVAPQEPVEDSSQDAALLEVGALLLKKWASELVLITLGEHGAMLFRRGVAPFHVETRAREVFDVSGAGDTVIALFTLALTAGATPEEAAEIANHASGIVVGKLGTATVKPEELLRSFGVE